MILTDIQEKAIQHLAASPLAKIFYWTGGTLLAYHHLQHRRSLDLDFFSEKPFSSDAVHEWAKSFKELAGFTNVTAEKIYDRWDFLFSGTEDLRIEFVLYNGEKKTLHPRNKLLGVYIDSLDDLAANKTMAYVDRAEPKDLFDMYFILTKGGFTSKKLLSLVERKFGVNYPESAFWRESYKGFPQLPAITPLMLEKGEEEKKKLLANIQSFFEESSNAFLATQLK